MLADQTNIFNLLTDMRGPADSTARNKKNDKFFQDYINDAWDTLGITEEQLYKTWEAIEITNEYFKGETETSKLTEYQKLILLEALIIEAVTRAIVHTKKNGEMVAVRRRDVYLLSIGLLEGYYHTTENGTYSSAAERHQQYIQRPDFIVITYFNSLLSDEYDIAEYQKKAKDLIATDDKRCREFLAKYLSKEDNCRICLEEGAKKHIKKVIRDGQNVMYQIKLPSPCYTLENFQYVQPSKDTTDKIKDSEDYDKPERTENDTHDGDYTRRYDPDTPNQSKVPSLVEPIDGKKKQEKDDELNLIQLFIDLLRKWFLKKVNLAVTLILIASVLSFIILKVFANNRKNVSIDMAMKIIVSENEISNVPPIDNGTLTNAISYSVETAPDVESFSIREKEFPLYPGYSKKLSIEQIYPLNADVSSISYELVPPGLLEIENALITALDDVPEGRTIVKIILKAKDCKETVYVTIENPNEEDEVFQGGPLFEQSQ